MPKIRLVKTKCQECGEEIYYREGENKPLICNKPECVLGHQRKWLRTNRQN